MAYAHHAGLADPRCQLYMLFYYIGPASVAVTMRRRRRRRRIATASATDKDTEKDDDLLGGVSINNGYSAGTITGTTASSYGATMIYNESETVTVATSNNGNVSSEGSQVNYDGYEYEMDDEERYWPSQPLLIKASSIALFDIFAQSMTFTGEFLVLFSIN